MRLKNRDYREFCERVADGLRLLCSRASTVQSCRGSHCSHIAVPALDDLADHRCRDLIGDLDVPDFAVALRHEVGEQLRDDRHIADLVAAQAGGACDVFGPRTDLNQPVGGLPVYTAS